MFEDKIGLNQHLLCESEDVRQGVKNWLSRVIGYYGDKFDRVDMQVIKDQIILNKTTAKYIYNDLTSLEIKYQKGSRPFLEKVLSQVITDKMSDTEKVFAIMRRCRDNRDAKQVGIEFNGGTEEDLIKGGNIMCNEISRVFAVLCQIAGLPARLIGSHISGHMMNEVYLNGKWTWFDCMMGNYFYNDDGSMASWWDLVQDPKLINRQKKSTWAETRMFHEFPELEPYALAFRQIKLRDCYLHPKEAQCVGNYYAWDHHKYDYPWQTKTVNPAALELARYAEAELRRKLNWPMEYFNPYTTKPVLLTAD